MVKHIRHAVRLLTQSPVFSLTAVLSLAIGIGATTAIFTAANAIFLAPTSGLANPRGLVDIGRTTQGRGFDTVSFVTYTDLRDRDSVFSGVYASRFEPLPVSLGSDAGADRVYAEVVSASYFDVLGLQPSVGTFFRTGEERVGTPLRKVVLSYALWRTRFGARPDVAGTDIVLNGDHFTIAGVGPPGFRGATIITPDLWMPITGHSRGLPTESALSGRENNGYILGARLKPQGSLKLARAYLDNFAADLRRTYPEIYREAGLAVFTASRVPGIGAEFVAPFLAVLMAIATLVLLVTCANLAGLLLARAASRSREVAVRLALGASRGALLRMLMTEALVLSVSGAAVALAVAWAMGRAMSAAIPSLPVPVSLDLAIDWRVLLFTTAVALATTCLTGLAPAWQSSRTDLVSTIKADASAPRRLRLRNAFITIQLAFCLVLIVVAGLFARALTKATHVDPGFAVATVDVASLDLALGGYPIEQASATADQLRERLAAVPGVAGVGFARMVTLDGGGLGLGGLRRAGTSGAEASIDTDWNVVSPHYFDALALPIVRGRSFTPTDRADSPRVAIVNERFARLVWPGQEPIGQRLENGDFRPGRQSTFETLTVVGIARDAKYRWVGEAPAPFIYVPFAQQPMLEVHYFLRQAAGSSMALQPAVRDVLKQFNPSLPLVRMQSQQSYADLGVLPQRLASSIAGSLGVVALLLAGIGIYGVTAFSVAARTREIGVRMALGADRGRVMRMVLWQGGRLAVIGGAIGLALAVAVTHLLAGLLFGISPLDPITYAATLGTLTVVTLAGTFVPARRAAAVNPMVSLRSQ